MRYYVTVVHILCLINDFFQNVANILFCILLKNLGVITTENSNKPFSWQLFRCSRKSAGIINNVKGDGI